MVRTMVLLGIACCLLTPVAMAGQSSGNFKVGITIGGVKARAAAAAVPGRAFTWGAATVSVRKAGFDNPQRVAKSGALYWFAAERAGNAYRIAVSISSGQVVKVIPA